MLYSCVPHLHNCMYSNSVLIYLSKNLFEKLLFELFGPLGTLVPQLPRLLNLVNQLFGPPNFLWSPAHVWLVHNRIQIQLRLQIIIGAISLVCINTHSLTHSLAHSLADV